MGRARRLAARPAAGHAALHRAVRHPRQPSRRAHRDDPDARVSRCGAPGHARGRRTRLRAAGSRGEHGRLGLRGIGCGRPREGVWRSRSRTYSLAPDTGHLVRARISAMKFLCVECDRQMAFAERELPGDGTLAATFKCPKCGRVVAMLTNPMETQLVSCLGVEIGGRTVPSEPLEMVRANVITGGPAWSNDAQERLSRVPSFVRGMGKKIYADYAKERGITEITPAIMDTARAELGLEGM